MLLAGICLICLDFATTKTWRGPKVKNLRHHLYVAALQATYTNVAAGTLGHVAGIANAVSETMANLQAFLGLDAWYIW